MKNSLLALIAVLGLLVPVTAAAPSADAPGKSPKVETVAGFAMKIAAALGAQTADPLAAVVSLRSLGCRLDEPQQPLTEGRAEAILADLGLGVLPPADPSKPISSARATVLAALAGMTVTTRSTGVSSSDPVTLPTQCLAEKNHGTCVECCKAATNCAANDLFACNVCARFCMNNAPPLPSDPEPQP